MRVAMADDSALFREGLRLILTAADFEVGVRARTGEELLTRIRTDPADVVIVDIRMPPTFTNEGVRIARRLRELYPETAVLVLSAYAETPYAVELLDGLTGGVGYLLKDRVDDVPTLCDALARLVKGETVVDPDIVRRLVARREKNSIFSHLTARERSVLRLMAEGRSNAGIARELHLGTKAIESYIASVFRRLEIHGTSDDNRRVLAVLRWLRARE